MSDTIKSTRQKRINADNQRIKKLEAELTDIREYENHIKSEIRFLKNRVKDAQKKDEKKEKSEG